MAIHMSRLARPLSRIGSHGWCRGSNHLATCLSKRYMQEFPERKADNTIPNDYLLVLPEALDEHEGCNELFKITRQHDIDYSKLDVEILFKGMSQALLNFENYLTDSYNQQNPELKPVEQFFRDIERHLYPLDSIFNVSITLMNVDSQKYRHSELYKMVERYYTARNQRFGGVFRESIQEYVATGFKKLSDADKKMVRMYYRMNTAGFFLRSSDAISQLSDYRKHLSNRVLRFRYNLDQMNEKFSHTVDDPDILASISSEFEDSQSLRHKERTPLKITVSTYEKFMRVCPDRFVRQMLWQTYNRRCSPKSSPSFNNIPVIEDIRVFRRKIADLSGYRTHLAHRLEDTMAESKQQISDFIQSLNDQNIPELNDRLQELTDFATDSSDSQISRTGLQEYDIDYWAHRYSHDILIGKNESELKTYFSLPAVMNGLKEFFNAQFGIEIRSRENEVVYWDRDVQTLDVSRGGKLVGSIIYDPYCRHGKRVNESFYSRIRCKTKESGLAPVRFASTAFNKDPITKQAHLSFLDITNLFYSFGLVIQRLLYNYDYYELNAYGALESDVTNLFPNLCLAHLLSNHKILQACSLRDGSKPIDSELASRVLKAHSYFRCFKTWRELYRAHLDLEVHTSLRDINKLVEDIYPIYSPFLRTSDNFDFCAMEGLFIGPNDGLQYSSLWSKQLANFCLNATNPTDGNQSGVDINKARTFNEKFLGTLLAPDNFNTKSRLFSLVGRSFEPTKTSLRVL